MIIKPIDSILHVYLRKCVQTTYKFTCNSYVAHPEHPPDSRGSEQSKLLIVIIDHYMTVVAHP